MTRSGVHHTVSGLLLSLTVAAGPLSPPPAGAQGVAQPDSTAGQSNAVVAAQSVLAPEALPDSLRRLLADIEPKLAPVRGWRLAAESALRADSATPRADSIFLQLREGLRYTVHDATRPFAEPDFQAMIWPDGAVADYRRRMQKLPERRPNPLETALADSVRSYLAEQGIWTSEGEGTAYFVPSETAVLSWFGRYVTPQIHAFLRFEAEQQAVPIADDASLMVSLDDLAQRLVTVGDLMNQFPNSPARPLVTVTYHQYLAAYLGGLPNTHAFHWRTRAMNPDFRRSHEQFLRQHASTAAGRVLAEYVTLLQRSGYRRTPEIDEFLRARWDAVSAAQRK